MATEVSDCRLRFGHEQFDPARLGQSSPTQCPVLGCAAKLVLIPYRRRTMPWCPEHGIRLHYDTFVYWNGRGLEDESRLRNFIVRPDLVRAIAFQPGAKAESHRLGYEMSEDALSWNVFVSLAVANKLREAVKVLTGRSLATEPSLYLWGERVDPHSDQRGTYKPLLRVRESLEPGIHRFPTEPDIMLVADDEMIISIEAKFGSGNPLAYEKPTKEGEKTTSRAGLLARYLGAQTSARTRDILRPAHIGPDLHSQLFRNVVFASEMAGEVPWHVVNLVSSTQRKDGKDARYSFDDPEPAVRRYLREDSQGSFTYRSWEQLYAAAIQRCPSLVELDRYLREKSAHYDPAFNLESAAV